MANVAQKQEVRYSLSMRYLVFLALALSSCSDTNTGGNVDVDPEFFSEFENDCKSKDGTIEMADDYYCSTKDAAVSYSEYLDIRQNPPN